MAIDHEVIIVGAGFSGIGVAIALRKAGFRDFLIVDDADGVGGTWHWNTYPGIAVDIPSFSYQYSFEQSTRWSRVYAPGRELKDYAEHCVDKYGLRPRIRFSTTIAAAEFDEDASVWTLRTSDGESLTARYVVGATGVLTRPKLPDIPGVESFSGITMHTSRWDHDRDLRGKRVAIIGTGASAVQVIPSIAPEVAELTVFQRTPIWCLPRPDATLPAPARWALRYLPGGQAVSRLASQAFVELTFPLSAHYYSKLPLAKLGERSGLAHLRRQVHDPAIRDKLTPRYALGCKRPGFSNDYLPTFNRDNVTLETDPIAEITPTGVRTANGTEYPADVLILATGFKVMESGNMPTFEMTGVGGRDLEKWWDENRLQAYEGVSVPGFPNFFSIIGPYGYNGASYFTLIEMQTQHIVRLLRHARSKRAGRIEVTAAANERYFREMLERRDGQVFWQDSCAVSNSYYFDKHGDVPLKPMSTVEAAWRAAHFDLRDYSFERIPAQLPTTRAS
ncbi:MULTISPECIES: NAD(P)/FAD-dependent oxidoreductase [Nocardia]|jgi:cation diffusion facilitator CzcD-associated flavoprotein CzcO|uniref:flavin-containing monooxygenase n=1 Tax=Nocardia TaxID=1817 RepID=UPI0007A4A134|nr:MULTISPECIES: NAD(P)/FAD-dependent oxidoreductase [Nocardia]OBF78024.1 monooxygenase [Mycobacterium sp. 852002-51759_SCH5129042]MBF6276185.1 NAD(P)/FAD-dependent oxidoreductase [Nocardia nova]OBA40931.1 monooxygenase [Nocardia sp. 852002-51101_SCH5132738]OBB39229.1 monooxygenase [Nocardia sp. 852002-51244_SCH5132740]PPI91899.1 NAD(P)/FAD-dependent oxidoreductase [Nocardia nova]